MIYPYLHYGNIVWGSTYKTNLYNLQCVQKRFFGKIAFRIFNLKTKDIYSKFNILNIMSINNYFTQLFIYKYLNNLLPSTMYLFDYFKPSLLSLHYSNRFTTKLFAIYCRTNVRKFSVRSAGVKYWNNLPNIIKNSLSISAFKTLLKKHLISTQLL